MTPFRLAQLSLQRRKVPTLITALSIAISVACSGILLRLYHLSASRFDSIGKNWEAVVGAKAGGIEILLGSLNAEGEYPGFLPQALYESLHASQAVHFQDGNNSKPDYLKSISPFLYFAKLGEFRVAGVDENFIKNMGENVYSEGHWAQDGEVVVGANVASHVGLHLGDSVKLQAWVGDHLGEAENPVKVSGILKPLGSAWDRMLFSSVVDAQKVVGANGAFLGDRSIWGEKVLNYFLINLQPGGFQQLQALVNKRTVGQAIRVDSQRQKLEELTGAGKSIGLFVSVFIILLSSLSVSAMLITRFEAMGVQLAVLRAIGYPRAEVAQWLLWEGVLLGGMGCLVGALLDAIGFPILRDLLGSAVPSQEIVGSSLLQSSPVWALAMIATTFAIFIPLIRLYRQDVHQALKG